MKYLSQELAKFHEQIRYAVSQYESPKVNRVDIQNIVICGLGGSGIAGHIIKNYFLDKLQLPVEVVADYTVPKYVSKHTLAIMCSYSGNTEETLSAYTIAREKGAQIIALTKGGQLMQLANEHGYTVYQAENGFQPRVALGYPLGYLLMLFFDLLGLQKKAELVALADKVSNAPDYIERSAKLAAKFKATIKQKFVIIADAYYEGLGVRLANQIQENAKLEAFCVVLPEANHNVIESYYEAWPSNYIFLNSGINQRTNLRFHFIKDLLKKYNSISAEIVVTDTSLVSLVETAYLVDWLSLQLADISGGVSNQIPNINDLKQFLAAH